MIINTGQRTDIPAFYADWLANRLREGFVCVRSPYNESLISRYRLDPSVVDLIGFCTKNPMPMFRYMAYLKDYGQLWFMTITPYGRDIEPNVPDKHELLKAFQKLSSMVGKKAVIWRYDPIILTDRYDRAYHLRAFEAMAKELEGWTDTVVISFIDLYPKVRRNYPEGREVQPEEQLLLGKRIIEIAANHGMKVKTCAEGNALAPYGADCSGCMSVREYERAIGKKLNVPKKKGARKECACYLSCDIGAYSTCMHMCRYCYANSNPALVLSNRKKHNPSSPLLVGEIREGEEIHEVIQKSWIQREISLFEEEERLL